MQLKEITGAVDKAATDPSRFNLTNEELSNRRRWIDNTGQQVIDGAPGCVHGSSLLPHTLGGVHRQEQVGEVSCSGDLNFFPPFVVCVRARPSPCRGRKGMFWRLNLPFASQVDTVHEALQGAIAAPPPPSSGRAGQRGGQLGGGGSGEGTEMREVNARFMGTEVESQALMMR